MYRMNNIKFIWESIKTVYLKEVIWEGINWIHLALDREMPEAPINTIMTLFIP
jgi:hypothetical protein